VIETRQRREDWKNAIDKLAPDFEITDRKELALAVDLAEDEYRFTPLIVGWDADTVDDLKALHDLLRRKTKRGDLFDLLNRLISAPRLTQGIAQELGIDERVGEEALRDAINRLAVVARIAAAKHKPRRKVPNEPLKAAVEVLADYWRRTLGRPFRQDHTAWVAPESRQKGPVPGKARADRFVYDALAVIGASRRDLDALGTVLRDFPDVTIARKQAADR